MGHLIGDKVRKAYDKSLMLEERKNYWSSGEVIGQKWFEDLKA